MLQFPRLVAPLARAARGKDKDSAVLIGHRPLFKEILVDCQIYGSAVAGIHKKEQLASGEVFDRLLELAPGNRRTPQARVIGVMGHEVIVTALVEHTMRGDEDYYGTLEPGRLDQGFHRIHDGPRSSL